MSKQILTSFDVETIGTNGHTGLQVYHGAQLYSFCIGYVDKNKKIKVNVYKYDQKGKQVLKNYFANPNYIKIAHNFIFELSILKSHNIEIHPDTLWHDTMLEHQMLFNNSHSHALDSVAFDFFGFTREYDKKFKKALNSGIQVSDLDPNFLYKYQVADGIRPLLIHYLLFPKIYKNLQLRHCYYQEIENAIFTQEEIQTGISLHQKNIKKMKITLQKALQNLRQYYKEDLNLDSPQQLGELLYNELKIKPLRFTSSGKPSTDKYAILELIKQNENPQLMGIIKNRSYSTGLANINKWLELQDINGIIHTSLSSNAANTGRKTSSEPNLYNINKNKALMNKFPVPLRKCFCPRRNHLLLPVDQAQIELRLIIDCANEKEILQLLKNNPDADMHHLTVECFSMKKIFEYKNDYIFNEGLQIANNLLQNDPLQYKTMRSAYKNTGFAIGYGAGLEKLTTILGKPANELFVGYHNFIKRLPKIASFSRNTIQEVKRTGGVMTSFGRFLRVDPARAYAGANYKIQGVAAQILKYGQNKVLQFFKKQKLIRWIYVCLDLYDENIFEVHKDLFLSDEFIEIHKQCCFLMENFDEIKIPLKTEWSICVDNWNDKQSLDLQNRKQYFD